jgi:hypothetical protein
MFNSKVVGPVGLLYPQLIPCQGDQFLPRIFIWGHATTVQLFEASRKVEFVEVNVNFGEKNTNFTCSLFLTASDYVQTFS